MVLFFLKFNIITAQKSTCVPFECNDTWDLFQDNDGKANALCREQCAEVVSIHSKEENEFVRAIAQPLLDDCQGMRYVRGIHRKNEVICKSRPGETNPDFDRILHSFFIGMHRIQFGRLGQCTRDPNIYCIWSDGTPCDFGNYTGVIGPHETVPPWATGNPNGIEQYGNEDCVEFYDSVNGYWNDIGCQMRLSGVICKRLCNSYCAEMDTQLK
uniref:C-type lectin domain-containing protein n=1 Tax=Meloidogyne javanica TaxID=6303 RepID=A0A915N5Q0_MELJA